MRSILQKRSLRFVFTANVISMLGSGMNAAAVAWYILQATHSEIALGTFAVLQTIPAMLMLPFTGVIIDREDRRCLVMWLDAIRALIILAVAILAFMGRAKIWELYLMNTLVAAGFWMFWPTITALIQELTPGEDFVHANTFLLAGIQGGWLIAGSIVGFVYNRIGLGGVLLIDFSTYLVSFLCYFAVRKGRHVVPRPAELRADIVAAETALERFVREMREGFEFLRGRRNLVFLGISWALFLAAMMTGVVVTPPLSDNVFHAGAVGYGWLNAGWGTGAFMSALYAPWFIAGLGARRSIAISMGLLTICMILAPLSAVLVIAVLIYGLMGSARGVTGVAMNTSIMEQVPQHFMGRVQNTFYFMGTALQILLALLVGAVAQVSLVAGFSIIGLVYAVAFICASLPVRATVPVEAATPVE
jgi:DHA3 family macrolide efflux protein-like MFS transporter